MSVSGVGYTYNSNGYYGNGASSINTLFENSANNSSANNSNTTSSMPTIDDLNNLAEYAAKAMESMGMGSDGRVTFSQISAYKEVLEKKFEDQMKADFEKLGIPIDAEFTISFDDEGKMVVDGDDANLAEIRQYFLDNPAMVDEYKEIKLLQDLEGARKSMQVNPEELRSRIQLESMASWWSESGNSSNMMANFSGGDLSFYKGINTTV